MQKRDLLILFIFFTSFVQASNLKEKRKVVLPSLDIGHILSQLSMNPDSDNLGPNFSRCQLSRKFLKLDQAIISSSEDEFIEKCRELVNFINENHDALVANNVEIDGNDGLKSDEIAINRIILAYRVYAQQEKYSQKYIPVLLSGDES